MIKVEFEAEDVSSAREKILEIERTLQPAEIKVRLVSGNSDKLLQTLDDGAKRLFADISERMKIKCISDKARD